MNTPKIKKNLNIPVAILKARDDNELSQDCIKGSKIFPNLYCSIFAVGSTGSGKTNILYNILKKTIDRDTTVIIFASTYYTDPKFKEISKFLTKRGVKHHGYTNFKEDGVNHVTDFMNECDNENKDDDDDDDDEKIKYNPYLIYKTDVKTEPPTPKPKKKKFAPKYFIAFDDLDRQLRDPSVQRLIKKSRHYKSKIWINSQYLKDLEPSTIANLWYMILFKKIPKETLKIIYDRLRIPGDYERFVRYYDYCVNEKFGFCYVNLGLFNNKFEIRKNFDKVLNF